MTEDCRLYFWMPRNEVAFLQAIVDSHEHLARIRTERNESDRALIVLMYDASQQTEIHEMSQGFEASLGQKLDFV
ncbi:MAG: hypothetical protein EA369_01055 [Bradymonadales bacterium]|nr:MAG: hypothetical protein EA369_01055 [Bradymonadales bacterium]